MEFVERDIERFKRELPYWCRTDCEVELYDKGQDEDGAPISTGVMKLKCLVRKNTSRVHSSNSMTVITEGECIFVGDIAPELEDIDSGKVKIKNTTYEISRGEKATVVDIDDVIFTRLVLK
jgi:hypothetical protein